MEFDFCSLFIKILKTIIQVLNKDVLLPNRTIKFSINNEKINYEIEIDNSKKTYTNEDYDAIIIILKEKDKIDKDSFFDIDKQIFNDNLIKTYSKKDIYLLHYQEGKK